jgi:hypothetical protein
MMRQNTRQDKCASCRESGLLDDVVRCSKCDQTMRHISVTAEPEETFLRAQQQAEFIKVRGLS